MILKDHLSMGRQMSDRKILMEDSFLEEEISKELGPYNNVRNPYEKKKLVSSNFKHQFEKFLKELQNEINRTKTNVNTIRAKMSKD